MGKMTKEELIECLTKKAELMDAERALDEKTDYMFCRVNDKDEIHISEDSMKEIIETLQPVVTYDPNWCERYPEDMEVSFHLPLLGRDFRIFSLYTIRRAKG